MARQKKQKSNRKHGAQMNKTDVSPALYQQALEKYNANQFNEANRLIQPYMKDHPGDAIALNLAGLIALKTGQIDKAIALFESAIKISERDHYFHNNLAVAIKDSGDVDRALPLFKKALELKPDYIDAAYNLGVAYHNRGELGVAKEWYEYALSYQSDFNLAYSNLICLYKDQWNIDQAIEGFKTAVQRDPENAHTHSNLLFCLNYIEGMESRTIFEYHQQWADRHAPETLFAGRDYLNDKTPGRRLRVGYVSPDFRVHSVAFFIQPILQNHRRNQVEVYCYSDVQKPDEVTQLIKQTADHWRNIHLTPDDQVFQQIQEDEIDILVDLTGHSGFNRLPLFARKPAPVQVAYLGYPNTTGMRAMDYRLTDDVADPQGIADPYYTEILIRLPGGFLCYQAASPAPDVSELPAVANGHITFGSFNNRAKITPNVVAVWSRILKQVTGSRLLLKFSIFTDEETRQRLLSMFAENGIEPSRIEISPYLPFQDHLRLYNHVDIALDTFPYNGTTTTFEALWMGVPVVTLTGKIHASCVGESILGQVGFQEGIAGSEADYIQKAANLAEDIDLLQFVRITLRRKLQSSSLMDAKGFVQKLENAYRHMWQQWCGHTVSDAPVLPDEAGLQDMREVRIRGDIAVCVPDSILNLSTYIFQEQEDWFESEIVFSRIFLKPGMKMIDMGAQLGVYGLVAARATAPTGKVWMFDPDPKTFDYLAESIRMNRFAHVTLIPVASSNLDRHAFLSVDSDSALNMDGIGAFGDNRTMAFMSLDEGLKNNVFEPDTDFLKIDLREQDDIILKRGKQFFKTCSPLVQYKIADGNGILRLEKVTRFEEIGYQSYYLIPGLKVLVPFVTGEKPDAFLLNLFCCKPDRAAALSRQGFLVLPESVDESLPAIAPSLWINCLQDFPYARRFLSDWQNYSAEHDRDLHWQIHQEALSAYSLSQSVEAPTGVRFQALKKAYNLMITLLRDHATVARILSAVRMAIDLGCRENAVMILNHLAGSFLPSRQFTPDEPFLPLSSRMASVDPGNDVDAWALYFALETRELNQSFSTFFTGKDTLSNLEQMKTFSFLGPEMERRLQLIQKRFGIIT